MTKNSGRRTQHSLLVGALCLVLFALCSSAAAQQPKNIPRIGFLSPESDHSGRFEAFRQELRDLGYVEGRNITIEYRASEDDAELKRLATELVREKIAVLITQGRATVQAKTAAATLPHVSGSAAIPLRPV